MKLIIAGGGTGGHLFPGIAVYEKLKSIDKDIKVYFIGTQRGIENKIKDDYDFEFFTINVRGFSGKNFMNKLRALKALFGAAKDVSAIFRGTKPDYVLGLGGYISFMPLFIARLSGIRSGVMEQNALPGLSNKILAFLGTTVFASFEETKKYLPVSGAIVTGNPVREKIFKSALALSESAESAESAEKLEFLNKKDLSIFISGGSQGASSLNNAVVSMLKSLDGEILRNLSIYHQTGERDLDAARSFYESEGGKIKKYEVFPFADNIENYYFNSDIVISRAGAGTLSELILFRKPAILVPYPFAAKNHQEENASLFSKKGCFYKLKDDKELSKELLQTVNEIFYNRRLLKYMSDSLKTINIEDSALNIASIILSEK